MESWCYEYEQSDEDGEKTQQINPQGEPQVNPQGREQVNPQGGQVNRGVTNPGRVDPAPRRKVMSKNVQKDQKYTENWVPIRSINNGMIHNDRGEMITGVKFNQKISLF
jgi:hypothetical protein